MRTAGMGSVIGLDYAALPFVLAAQSVPESEWMLTLQKLIVIQKVAMDTQSRHEERRRAMQPPPAPPTTRRN